MVYWSSKIPRFTWQGLGLAKYMKKQVLIKLLECSGQNTKKIVLDFFKNTDVKGYQELIRDLQEAINVEMAKVNNE